MCPQNTLCLTHAGPHEMASLSVCLSFQTTESLRSETRSWTLAHPPSFSHGPWHLNIYLKLTVHEEPMRGCQPNNYTSHRTFLKRIHGGFAVYHLNQIPSLRHKVLANGFNMLWITALCQLELDAVVSLGRPASSAEIKLIRLGSQFKNKTVRNKCQTG